MINNVKIQQLSYKGLIDIREKFRLNVEAMFNSKNTDCSAMHQDCSACLQAIDEELIMRNQMGCTQ